MTLVKCAKQILSDTYNREVFVKGFGAEPQEEELLLLFLPEKQRKTTGVKNMKIKYGKAGYRDKKEKTKEEKAVKAVKRSAARKRESGENG